jgi:hypothetical protein
VAKFVSHIEELKIYLDSVSNPAAMKTRLGTMESMIGAKEGAEHYPTRSQIMGEASFMVKNKERVTKAVGTEKYMEVFHGLIKFLEKHPPEKKKKKSQAQAAFDAFEELTLPTPRESGRAYRYSLPTWGTTTGTGVTYAIISTDPAPTWQILHTEGLTTDDVAAPDIAATATVTTVSQDLVPNLAATLDQIADQNAGTGGTLIPALQELMTALETGGYNMTPGSLVEGAALHRDLDPRAPTTSYEFGSDDHEDDSGWG